MIYKTLRYLMSVTSVATLVACGGGGGSDTTSVATIGVTSSSFIEGAPIPSKHRSTYSYLTASTPESGGIEYNVGTVFMNLSIPLAFSAIPSNAQSLAIVMDDLDSPCTTGCRHWFIYNIPVTTTATVQNQNFSLITGSAVGLPYSGPQPPNKHTYNIAVYALKNSTITPVKVPKEYTRSEFEAEFSALIVGKGLLKGTFDPANP